ncbi:MAG: hypothetical protein H0U27_02160, partial [Nitrosopumilus sp.]|nr:hypothetical protein [Nitrosopumilus sp.]
YLLSRRIPWLGRRKNHYKHEAVFSFIGRLSAGIKSRTQIVSTPEAEKSDELISLGLLNEQPYFFVKTLT